MPEVLRRRAGLSRALERWLPQRRWYAGKGRTIRQLAIDDAIALDNDANVALLVVTVSFTEGDDHRYSVPVMRIGRDLAETGDRSTSPAAIAHLDDGALLVDAMSDARGAAVVLGAALRKRSRSGRHGELRGHPRRGRIAKLADDPRRVNVLGVEQSNSSAIIDGRLIAKLVRRLEPGTNPDVELPTHLLAAGFDRVPGVAATLEIDVAGEPAPANVVVVHDAVPHESDLWVKMLDELGLAIDQVLAAEGHRDVVVDTSIARLVGQRTAELHHALSRTDVGTAKDTNAGSRSSPMAPESFTLHWQRSLLQTLRTSIRSTQRDLRRARRGHRLADAAVAQAAGLDAQLDRLMDRFDRLRDEKFDAKRIRLHGDLHLGQILWEGHDIVFIDFEGEPGAPMAQRTIKRSPLADVAGLLRSFDYAGRMALHTAVERGRVIDLDDVDAWRQEWTRRNHDALLDAYFEHIDGAGLIPAADADRRLLLDVYAATKALYEVRYELANRPDWVSWPMSAILEMLDP
jgi:maltose alpha-D-glucosyltransferase/alpha-amylase